MATVEVRPVRPEDLEHFDERTRLRTIKAAVATVDGVPAAIAGIAFHDRATVAFCECHDALKPFPMAIIALTEKAMDIFEGVKGDLIAIKDASIPTSDKFLAWCGFEYLNTSPDGEVYICKL